MLSHIPPPTSHILSLSHQRKEFLVRLRLLHLLDQERYGLFRRHVAKERPQEEDTVPLFLVEQQLFLARPRLEDVDRRIDALVRDLATEDEFHVARTLELLEDHLVHP